MLACMKGFSSFGAIIICIVGLATAGISIYGYTHSEIFLDDTQSKNTILGIMSGSAALIILSSILGMCGIKKGNVCLILIFQIMVIVFMIVFFSLGIASHVFPGRFFEGNCTTSENPTIEDAYEVYDVSQQTFCKLGCSCGLTDQAIESHYNATEQITLKGPTYSRAADGPIATQDCSVQPLNDTEKRLAIAIGEIEKAFDCSGWCENDGENLIYRFSNVNDGKPQRYCYETLKSEVNHYGSIIEIAAFGTAAFLLLVCAVNICICCHPSRKGLKMKDRFVYMRDGQYERV